MKKYIAVGILTTFKRHKGFFLSYSCIFRVFPIFFHFTRRVIHSRFIVAITAALHNYYRKCHEFCRTY